MSDGGSRSSSSSHGSQREVLLTGGLGDIGLATAVRLTADGYGVTLVDLATMEAGGRAVDAVNAERASGAGLLTYRQADVTNREQMAAVIESMPALHVGIANAGTVISAPFLEITQDQWQRHLDVNLTGAFITAQLCAQRLVRDGTPGLLLFTGSWVADVPWPEITAYTATKAALQMVAKQAARELAPYGIRANTVAPGIVRAGLAKSQLENDPGYAARAGRVIPLKSFQTADQVADAFAFLSSPAASYMTGATLLVDGGASLYAFD